MKKNFIKAERQIVYMQSGLALLSTAVIIYKRKKNEEKERKNK